MTELHLNDLLAVVPTYRRLKEPDTKRGYFTREEIAKLLDNAPRVAPHGSLLRDSIEFSVVLGCRQGELLGLEWGQVDLEMQSITFLDTKNGTDHTLPIPDSLMPTLERRYKERIDEQVFPWRDKDELLRRFKALKKMCQLPTDSRVWHSLRHTCGTWMVESGVPIRSVMSVLNHKNIETTLRYSKATTDAKAAAINAINL
jgi:integrase